MMRFPIEVLAVLVAGSFAGCSKGEPVSSPPPVEVVAPEPTAPGVAVADPCALFTGDDFAAVFDKAAADPGRNEDSTWAVCSYAFADYARSNIGYGLDVKVTKGSVTRDAFMESYEALAGRMQAVDGVGDIAYLLPAANAESSIGMFVLVGRTGLVLSLYEPRTMMNGQGAIQAVARKIVKRLAGTRS
jgi:hypothetical protein